MKFRAVLGLMVIAAVWLLAALPQVFAGSLEYRTRFEREAQLVTQLQHPHIIPVFDVGEHVTCGPQLIRRRTQTPCDP